MKKAGIRQIAEMAGVSIGTVDRALHNRPGIRESTRRRVIRLAKRLDYSPHPAARVLSVGRASVRIGVCIPEEIRFYYDQIRTGIFDEARRAGGMGLEIDCRPVRGLGKKEAERISNLLATGVNALIVTPGDPAAVSPIIDRAERQNVRVVCITTDAPRSRRSTFVGVDPGLSGRLAAELMARFVPAGSKAAVITGMLATQEHHLKSDGFCTGFRRDCRNGIIAAVLEAQESEEEDYRKTCRLLGEHPDLRGIYVSTANCLPVCRALKDRRMANRVQVVATDLFPKMAPYLRRGTIQASIYQNPYLQGQTAIRLLTDYLLNGAEMPKYQYMNPSIVLRANLTLFRELSRD